MDNLWIPSIPSWHFVIRGVVVFVAVLFLLIASLAITGRLRPRETPRRHGSRRGPQCPSGRG